MKAFAIPNERSFKGERYDIAVEQSVHDHRRGAGTVGPLYYIIRAAVSAGIKDAYAQMGFIREPDTKEDQLQRRREELQEERVQTIVNSEADRMSGKNGKH